MCVLVDSTEDDCLMRGDRNRPKETFQGVGTDIGWKDPNMMSSGAKRKQGSRCRSADTLAEEMGTHGSENATAVEIGRRGIASDQGNAGNISVTAW